MPSSPTSSSLRAKGTELLLVHGGAQTTNAVAEALGHPAQFVTSETGHVSRRTDRRTLEIFEMVYCGQLNKMWVEKLQTKGINAVGLSGLDGRVFEGSRKDTLRIRVDGRRMVLRDDWTGTVETREHRTAEPVDRRRLLPGSDAAWIVDGRRSDQRRRRSRRGDGGGRIQGGSAGDPHRSSWTAQEVPRRIDARSPQIPKGQADKFMEFAEGRMKKKVMGAVEAIDEGVGKVIFADGRVDEPITRALAGAGTHIG